MKNKHIYAHLIGFILLVMSTSLLANPSAAPSAEKAEKLTTLYLKKINNQKQIAIGQNEEIILWLNDGSIKQGYFDSIEEDSLVLITAGVKHKILVQQVTHLKLVASPAGRIFGGIFLAAGIGAMVLGGVSLIAGVAALLAEDLGAIILIAVPILGGGGFGLYALGRGIGGKKYNLQKKWQIVQN